ncbi:hypothetical protein OE88DRAFT_231352 [Heliocybe sulcata]|uniref:Uncharacterized protein n=1 Tax=Heliocybe sulcata TaxID=5364 RepID=A0A5C3MXL7_9AGAM|nr:hypothetical protein OE88DRAFT_231352 [Heliocybe sulcata]
MFLPPDTDKLQNLTILPVITGSVDTCHDIDNCRTLLEIVRSCFITIFACTWVSLHLNIPPRDQAWYRGPLRHFGVMLMGIIAPELVVAWAARQWYVSRELEKKYRKYADMHRKPWSRTHSFFALMGGYVLCDGRSAEVLDIDVEQDFVDFFSSSDSRTQLTADDLADKGKKDWLSKSFAVVQTAWFILQCVARSIQHRALSELEVATCGFAVLNAVTYYLWFDKPQGVRLPFLVDIQGSVLAIDKLGGCIVRAEEPGAGRQPQVPSATRGSTQYLQSSQPTGPSSHQHQQPELPVVHHLWTKLTDFLHKRLPSGILYAFVEMAGNDHLHAHELSGTAVPTFYSGDCTPKRDDVAITISVGFSILFGAIHCLAWRFDFPSYAEATMWRTCSLAITCLPALRLVTYFVQSWAPATYEFMMRNVLGKTIVDVKGWGWWVLGLLVKMVNHFGVIAYIGARFILLVLVFTLLRSLPPSAFETVSWTMFIPHI